jgi:uncharacterized protein YndB with AHSA1/START domain
MVARLTDDDATVGDLAAPYAVSVQAVSKHLKVLEDAGLVTRSAPTDTSYEPAAIEADPTIPAIHSWRDFAGTPGQLFRAHTEPELLSRWIGPAGSTTEVLAWEARDNGRWRYRISDSDGEPQSFRGSFHTVRTDRIVQTFTWEGMPDAVALETTTFEDLGDSRTSLHGLSLCDSFEGRDAWLRSGMEVGVNDGYAEIDRMLADGSL